MKQTHNHAPKNPISIKNPAEKNLNELSPSQIPHFQSDIRFIDSFFDFLQNSPHQQSNTGDSGRTESPGGSRLLGGVGADEAVGSELHRTLLKKLKCDASGQCENKIMINGEDPQKAKSGNPHDQIARILACLGQDSAKIAKDEKFGVQILRSLMDLNLTQIRQQEATRRAIRGMRSRLRQAKCVLNRSRRARIQRKAKLEILALKTFVDGTAKILGNDIQKFKHKMLHFKSKMDRQLEHLGKRSQPRPKPKREAQRSLKKVKRDVAKNEDSTSVGSSEISVQTSNPAKAVESDLIIRPKVVKARGNHSRKSWKMSPGGSGGAVSSHQLLQMSPFMKSFKELKMQNSKKNYIVKRYKKKYDFQKTIRQKINNNRQKNSKVFNFRIPEQFSTRQSTKGSTQYCPSPNAVDDRKLIFCWNGAENLRRVLQELCEHFSDVLGRCHSPPRIVQRLRIRRLLGSRKGPDLLMVGLELEPRFESLLAEKWAWKSPSKYFKFRIDLVANRGIFFSSATQNEELSVETCDLARVVPGFSFESVGFLSRSSILNANSLNRLLVETLRVKFVSEH